jgi:mannitol-specific phosphotransferase system IIBC component
LDINIAGVVGFIVASLLIPLIVYIWNNQRRELREMKDTIKRHQEDNVKRRRLLTADVQDCKIENQKIRTNYLDRFSKLSSQISNEFAKERQANVDEHKILSQTVNEINVNIASIVAKLSTK